MALKLLYAAAQAAADQCGNTLLVSVCYVARIDRSSLHPEASGRLVCMQQAMQMLSGSCKSLSAKLTLGSGEEENDKPTGRQWLTSRDKTAPLVVNDIGAAIHSRIVPFNKLSQLLVRNVSWNIVHPYGEGAVYSVLFSSLQPPRHGAAASAGFKIAMQLW